MPGSGPPILVADEDLPAPPRQARSLVTRKKLLEAGRNLFAEQGYHATSIQELTARAGTAAGAFYTYFRSKRQLLIVLMNELLERLGDLDLWPTGSDTDARSGLRSFLAAVFRADLAYYGVVRAWQEAALTDAGLAWLENARRLDWPSVGSDFACENDLSQHPLFGPPDCVKSAGRDSSRYHCG